MIALQTLGKPYSHPSHPTLKCSPQILACQLSVSKGPCAQLPLFAALPQSAIGKLIETVYLPFQRCASNNATVIHLSMLQNV